MDDLIVVNRPIQEVFEFMTNQSNARLWKPFVTESRQITDGEIGVGTRFVEGIDVLNRHLVSIVEVLDYKPHHWFSYKTRDESVPFSLVAQMSFEETPLDTMGSNKRVVSAKLLIEKKGEAYDFRNDHHRSVYSNSTAPLHCIRTEPENLAVGVHNWFWAKAAPANYYRSRFTRLATRDPTGQAAF